jgi:hypothetical protein
MRRLRSAALAAAVGVALAAPAAADERSEAMLGAFVAAIDAAPGWSAAAGAVLSEGADTIGEGLTFTLSEPAVSISIERLRLRDLKAREGGGFSASDIEMTGGALVSEFVDYAIPSASLTGFSAPSTEGLALDPHHLMTSMAKLYSIMADLEFAEFSIPTMTVEQRDATGAAPAGTVSQATYSDIVSSDLRGGVLARSAIGPMTVSVTSPDVEGMSFEIGGLAAERVDLGALARIFDPAQYAEDGGEDAWRPIVASTRYEGLSASWPGGGSFRLDEMVLENIEGRQPDEPFTQAWDLLLDPTIAEDVKGDLALEAITGMHAIWRLGALRFSGLAVDVPAAGSAVAVGGLAVTGLSVEGIEGFAMTGLEADTPLGFLSAEAFEFSGFTFPDLDALLQFAALEADATTERHEATMRAAFAGLPRLSRLDIANVAAGLSRDQPVSLGRLSIALSDWNEFFAESTDIALEGLVLPSGLLAMDDVSARIVEALGEETVTVSVAVKDRWLPDLGADETTWTISLEDAADLEIAYRIDGVTAAWIVNATALAAKGADSEEALMDMLAGLAIPSASVTFTDRSLVDIGLGIAAEMQGLNIDGAAYRTRLAGALPFLLKSALPAALADRVTPALQEFLAGGPTLVATIEPKQPLGIEDLIAAAGMDPQAIFDMLGVTLSAGSADSTKPK